RAGAASFRAAANVSIESMGAAAVDRLAAVHEALAGVDAAARPLVGAVTERHLSAAAEADLALREALAVFAQAVAAMGSDAPEAALAKLHARLEAIGDLHRRASALLSELRDDAAEDIARARGARRGTHAYLEAAAG